MEWIVNFFFSKWMKSYISASIYKSEPTDIPHLYNLIFGFAIYLVMMTFALCAFILANLGHRVHQIGFAFIILLSLGCGYCVKMYAKKIDFIEKKAQEVKSLNLSGADLKEYSIKNMYPGILICLYPIVILIVCYLIQHLIFHH